MRNHKDYEDIIHLPHHVSDKHPQMLLQDRAAQFAPFAALTGYGDVIRETARHTEARIQLDEYELAELDMRFRFLVDHLSENPFVTITYFEPDGRKAGGAYRTVKAQIKKIDLEERWILLGDGTRISLGDICGIDFEVA